jgi:hypothetical protein
VRHGFDTKVICLSRLANTLGYLGETEAAVATRDRAMAMADELGDPNTGDITRVFAALLSVELGDIATLRRCVTSFGDSDAAPIATMREAYAGYLDVLEGRPGVARIQHAVDHARGEELAPGFQATLARILVGACVLAGDVETGLAVPAPAGLLEGRIRQLQAELRRGTLGERTTSDASRP